MQELDRPYHIGQGLNRPDNGCADMVSALQLTFPRSLLPLPPEQLERLAAVPLGPSSGVGSLASQLLIQFAAGMDEFTPAEAARLSTAALDVLATRLASELGSDSSLPPETHKRALLVRIHAFIQEHLGDPELSPGVIAAAHHVSIRTLHTLFNGQGETVAGWIRQRRLEATRRELSDPRRNAAPSQRLPQAGASPVTPASPRRSRRRTECRHRPTGGTPEPAELTYRAERKAVCAL